MRYWIPKITAAESSIRFSKSQVLRCDIRYTTRYGSSESQHTHTPTYIVIVSGGVPAKQWSCKVFTKQLCLLIDVWLEILCAHFKRLRKRNDTSDVWRFRKFEAMGFNEEDFWSMGEYVNSVIESTLMKLSIFKLF